MPGSVESMSLIPTKMDVTRTQGGSAFYMRIKNTDQFVRIFVQDEILSGFEEGVGEFEMSLEVDVERGELERIACEKFERGQITPDGCIVITIHDLTGE
jgi:hypothetical protein